MYKVRCPTADAKQKPKYQILHRNRLLLVTNKDDTVIPGQRAQAKVTPMISNATLEASVDGKGSFEPLPSLVTRQEGDMTSQVWLTASSVPSLGHKLVCPRLLRVLQTKLRMRSLILSQTCLTPSQRGRSPMATRPLGLTICETSQMAT